MPAETLQAILVRCAQCNMTEDIKGFALRIVSEGTGAGPGPSAVAAALVDNPSLSHNVLQSSGLQTLPPPPHPLIRHSNLAYLLVLAFQLGPF